MKKFRLNKRAFILAFFIGLLAFPITAYGAFSVWKSLFTSDTHSITTGETEMPDVLITVNGYLYDFNSPFEISGAMLPLEEKTYLTEVHENGGTENGQVDFYISDVVTADVDTTYYEGIAEGGTQIFDIDAKTDVEIIVRTYDSIGTLIGTTTLVNYTDGLQISDVQSVVYDLGILTGGSNGYKVVEMKVKLQDVDDKYQTDSLTYKLNFEVNPI